MKILAVFLLATSAFAQKPNVKSLVQLRGELGDAIRFHNTSKIPEFVEFQKSEECERGKIVDPFLLSLVNGLRNGFFDSFGKRITVGDKNWGIVKKVSKTGNETFRQDLVAYKDSDGKITYFDFVRGGCGPDARMDRDLNPVTFEDSENEFLWWASAPLDPAQAPSRARGGSRGPSSKKP